MTDKQNIRDFRPGQKQLSAANMNKIAKAARQRFIGTSGININQTGDSVRISLDHKYTDKGWWLGKIWNDGLEPNYFTDEHYCVYPVEIDSSLTASDLVFSDLYFPSDIPVIVTNLTERATGTHLLSDLQVVVIFEAKDAGSPPARRFVMSEDVGYSDTSTDIFVKVSNSDTTANYLADKIITTDAWLSDISSGAGDETLDITHIGPDDGTVHWPSDSVDTSSCAVTYAFDGKGHCIGWWKWGSSTWYSPWGLSSDAV